MLKNFFLYCSYFSNNLILRKIKRTFSKFCISVTNRSIWMKFSDTIVKLKIRWFCRSYFLHLVYISKYKAFFLYFEHHLNIINLLYLNHEPVEFDKIIRSKCKIEKKIILLKNFFQFEDIGFFRLNKFFCVQFLVKSMKLIINNCNNNINNCNWNCCLENEILRYVYLTTIS